jgi:hypothetical protein
MVESISLMGRGVSEEVCAATSWRGLCGEENGAREREENELEYELDSGKMSMYTGVRVSGRRFRLDDGMSRYWPEDMDEPVDEQVDELSLLDVEELEYKEEGEWLNSSSNTWLWVENLRDEWSTSLRASWYCRESITSKNGKLAMHALDNGYLHSRPSDVSLNCCRRLPICFDDRYFPVLR